MEFRDWITKKYIEWRGETRNSVQQFSLYLGISQSTVSAWINGTRGIPTSKKIISKLFEVYGDEIFSILGYDDPDSEKIDISSLPEDLQERLRTAMSEIDEAIKSRAGLVDSEDTSRLVRETFSKYGFTITKKE